MPSDNATQPPNPSEPDPPVGRQGSTIPSRAKRAPNSESVDVFIARPTALRPVPWDMLGGFIPKLVGEPPVCGGSRPAFMANVIRYFANKATSDIELDWREAFEFVHDHFRDYIDANGEAHGFPKPPWVDAELPWELSPKHVVMAWVCSIQYYGAAWVASQRGGLGHDEALIDQYFIVQSVLNSLLHMSRQRLRDEQFEEYVEARNHALARLAPFCFVDGVAMMDYLEYIQHTMIQAQDGQPQTLPMMETGQIVTGVCSALWDSTDLINDHECDCFDASEQE